MVRPTYGIRLILELLAGIILLTVALSVMLIAAATVGWLMVLGMLIVFAIEAYKTFKSHTL
jgi:hypothetical protein